MVANQHEKVDYEDEHGCMRRVLLPVDTHYPPEEGIPVDFYEEIFELYRHTPPEFCYNLIKALYARNLVEPEDFMDSDAKKRYQAAMLSVLKHDAYRVEQKVMEMLNDNS